MLGYGKSGEGAPQDSWRRQMQEMDGCMAGGRVGGSVASLYRRRWITEVQGAASSHALIHGIRRTIHGLMRRLVGEYTLSSTNICSRMRGSTKRARRALRGELA